MQRSEAVSHGRSDFTVGLDRAAGDARYLKKNSVQVAATDYAALGASPPGSGAIRVDAASYAGGVAMRIVNGPSDFRIVITAPGNNTLFGEFGTGSTDWYAGGEAKFRLSSGGGVGVSQLTALQATVRLIGGAINGLAIRNSANTRDNFRIGDTGFWTVTNGTHTTTMQLVGVSGERFAGALLTPDAVGSSLNIGSFLSTGASSLSLLYWDGVVPRSALEVANAAGFSTLVLMKSGGPVVIGATSAHTTAQHQGDSTTQGWLFPRMTTTQKTNISSPATGLVVFDTTLAKLCVFTGAVWETITSV